MDAITVLTSVLKIGAVLALLVISLRLLGRHQAKLGTNRAGRGARASVTIEILDQTRLSRTATIATVRVGDRILLLGTTEGSVQTLADVTDDIDLTVPEDGDESDPTDETVLHHALDLLRSGRVRP